MKSRTVALVIAAVGCLAAFGSGLGAQGAGRATVGEWRTYGGDLASTRYSPLDQINATISTSSKSRGDSRPTPSARDRSSTSSRRR